MHIGYIKNRQDLGFMCLKDIEDFEPITLVLKTGVIYITITIFINSSLFTSNLELANQSYSHKLAHERVVPNILNQKFNTLKSGHNGGLNVQTGSLEEVILVEDEISEKHLINEFRGGNLTDDADQNSEKINQSSEESVRLDKLQNSLVSKSVGYSKSFTDNSFNKIVIRILDKIQPIIGNQTFLRILSEVQKPLKSELPISVQSSSKDSMNSKSQKIPVKRSSTFFVDALVPVNPCRWPAFTAGSAMASDMPDVPDKLRTPFSNLLVAKEYLETSQSDLQYRGRLWQVAQDTLVINVASEQADVVGPFVAGAASNKVADRYMAEMVDTEVNKNNQEKLNLEMFKQTAREQGKDDSQVRGTGLTREFVPDFMQEDICHRPERNARPNSWEDNHHRYEDESFFN